MTEVPLSVGLWDEATKLGEERVARGDTFRQAESDRGSEQNRRNDIGGVLAERIAGDRIEQIPGVEVFSDLYNTAGPVDDGDLQIKSPGNELKNLDVKSLMITPRRHWLLIAKKAFEKHEKRGVTGYIPVIFQERGAMALIGSVIPVKDVTEAWESAPESVATDAPAYGLKLPTLSERYFDGRDLHSYLEECGQVR